MEQHGHLRRVPIVYDRQPMYYVTSCTRRRAELLACEQAWQVLTEEWKQALDRHGCRRSAHMVMPDHVHFFCRPTPVAASLSSFMATWKQWSSKKIKSVLGLKESVWQKGFFDHILRSDESYSEKWSYVRENPVRAGLVTDAEEWRYQGSVHFR